jgi:hypothetical protein
LLERANHVAYVQREGPANEHDECPVINCVCSLALQTLTVLKVREIGEGGRAAYFAGRVPLPSLKQYEQSRQRFPSGAVPTVAGAGCRNGYRRPLPANDHFADQRGRPPVRRRCRSMPLAGCTVPQQGHRAPLLNHPEPARRVSGVGKGPGYRMRSRPAPRSCQGTAGLTRFSDDPTREPMFDQQDCMSMEMPAALSFRRLSPPSTIWTLQRTISHRRSPTVVFDPRPLSHRLPTGGARSVRL